MHPVWGSSGVSPFDGQVTLLLTGRPSAFLLGMLYSFHTQAPDVPVVIATFQRDLVISELGNGGGEWIKVVQPPPLVTTFNVWQHQKELVTAGLGLVRTPYVAKGRLDMASMSEAWLADAFRLLAAPRTQMVVAELFSRPNTCILLHPSDCLQLAETDFMRHWWAYPWLVDSDYFCSAEYTMRKTRGGVPAPEQVAALNYPATFLMRSSHDFSLASAIAHVKRMQSVYVLPAEPYGIRFPERFHDSTLPQNRPTEIASIGWMARGTFLEAFSIVLRSRIRYGWKATGGRVAAKVRSLLTLVSRVRSG